MSPFQFRREPESNVPPVAEILLSISDRYPLLILSFGPKSGDISRYLVSQRSGIWVGKFFGEGKLSTAEWAKIARAAKELSGRQIYLADDCPPTADEIERRISLARVKSPNPDQLKVACVELRRSEVVEALAGRGIYFLKNRGRSWAGFARQRDGSCPEAIGKIKIMELRQ